MLSKIRALASVGKGANAAEAAGASRVMFNADNINLAPGARSLEDVRGGPFSQLDNIHGPNPVRSPFAKPVSGPYMTSYRPVTNGDDFFKSFGKSNSRGLDDASNMMHRNPTSGGCFTSDTFWRADAAVAALTLNLVADSHMALPMDLAQSSNEVWYVTGCLIGAGVWFAASRKRKTKAEKQTRESKASADWPYV